MNDQPPIQSKAYPFSGGAKHAAKAYLGKPGYHFLLTMLNADVTVQQYVVQYRTAPSLSQTIRDTGEHRHVCQYDHLAWEIIHLARQRDIDKVLVQSIYSPKTETTHSMRINHEGHGKYCISQCASNTELRATLRVADFLVNAAKMLHDTVPYVTARVGG